MADHPERIPKHLDEITPDWINAHVFPDHGGNPVIDMTHQDIGDGRGFLSQTFRVETNRAGPAAHLPESFVVKIRPDSAESRKAEEVINGFLREVRFYADVARDTDARLTEVYFAEVNPDRAALVMEDLSHFKGGDQVVGLSHEQVRNVIRAIAPIHAAFWESPALDGFNWAPTSDYFHIDHYAEGWPEFEAVYGLRIGPKARAVGDYLARNVDRLEDIIANRPHSIVHGDLRADNILFGEDDHAGEVIILDWQLVMRSLPALDIARLYGGSEPVLERADRHRQVVGLWHSELVRNGVTDYSGEAAWRDFQLAMLHCTAIPVRNHVLFGKTPQKRSAQMRDAMAERFFSCVVEIDALEALK
ncbi:MAG: oxidoreductase family protein [Pseudomonadota bacterium]